MDSALCSETLCYLVEFVEKMRTPKGTLPLRVFCIFFALFGTDIQQGIPTEESIYGRKKTKRTSKRFFLIRSFTFAAFVTYVAGSSFASYELIKDRLSLLDFVRVSYNVMAYATIFSGLFVMNLYEAELSQILFRSEFFVMSFQKRYFFNVLLLNVASFTIDVLNASDAFTRKKPLLIFVGYLCGVYLWQGQTATLCMYVQCQISIRVQLKQLADLVRLSSFSQQSVLRIAQAKQSIRRTIERVNSIFGNVLLFFYMKLFTLVTLRIGAIILWGTEHSVPFWLKTMYIISASMQILQIYETTRLGSEIIIESQKLVRFLYQPRRMWEESKWKALAEVRRVIKFRQHFDVLLISDSFTNWKATIFTFLGTMFTCIAIILQFDFDVLQTLERAKNGVTVQEGAADQR